MALYITHNQHGDKLFICGDLGPHCAECADCADNLCDYPVSKNKTCNRMICNQHSNEIHPNHHYCTAHFQQYCQQGANTIFKTEVEGSND